MNLNKLFAGDKEKREAINQLESLAKNPNWIFFSKTIIQNDIDMLSEEILDFRVLDDEGRERENDMKRRRAYMIIMTQLPEKIINALKDNSGDIPEFDPYAKTVKDLKEL